MIFKVEGEAAFVQYTEDENRYAIVHYKCNNKTPYSWGYVNKRKWKCMECNAPMNEKDFMAVARYARFIVPENRPVEGL